jgi:hypothetical protein
MEIIIIIIIINKTIKAEWGWGKQMNWKNIY